MGRKEVFAGLYLNRWKSIVKIIILIRKEKNMSNISEQIGELLNTSGMDAPDMTRALKVIGEGDMQNGIKKLADYCNAVGNEQGYNAGDRNGTVKGSLVTLLVVAIIGGGVYIKNKYVACRQKKLDAEGNEILQAIKDSVPAQDVSEEDCPSFPETGNGISSTKIQEKG